MSREELQERFWDEAGQRFGYDIIGSKSHPMRKAFKLFCKQEGFYVELDFENERKEKSSNDSYTLVMWPQSQDYMGENWFENEAILEVECKFGLAAYFIPTNRIKTK